MKEINILVLGVGGVVSQGIIKALRNSGLSIKLIGACISTRSMGLYLCDKAYVSPYANDNKFIPWLTELCNREQVDIVLTGVEENILAIAEQIDFFRSRTKAIFISSDFEHLKIGQDKFLTCEWLKNNGCNYPIYTLAEECTADFVQKVGYPIVAKPRNGKGSNGVFLIHNEHQLKNAMKLQGYVLQECIGIPEQEYTVGCYCDKKGQLVDMIVMHRDLQHGSTDSAKVIENPEISEQVIKICEKFCPVGPLNVQMRLDEDGRPVCFELNVRFSGTTPMRAMFGFQDVVAMVKEYVLGEDIKNCFCVRPGIAYRYTNELYILGDIGEIKEDRELLSQLDDMRVCVERLGK